MQDTKAMKAVAYVRVSTEEQALEGRSLEVQERVIRQYCDRNSISLAKIFIESASAYRHDAREQFRAMLDFIERHEQIEAIVVWKTIRAFRNVTDWAYVTERARGGRGILLLSVTEGFPLTREGQVMSGLSALYGRWQSVILSEQVKANMKAWAERGVWPNWAPYGYRNRRKTQMKQRGLGIEPDPDVAPKIKMLFEFYATGLYTLTETAKYANEIGLRGRLKGRKIRANRVQEILTNPVYAGKVRWCGQVYDGVHEPIVTQELFDRVQWLIREKGHSYPGRHVLERRHRFPLKGLVTCGQCGKPVQARYTRGNGGLYIHYGCQRHKPQKFYREEWLFERVEEYLEPLALPGDLLREMGKIVQRKIHEARESAKYRVKRLEEEREAIERKIDAALDAYLERQITAELWKRKSEEWNRRSSQIGEEIRRARASYEISEKEVIGFLRDVANLPRLYGRLDRFNRGQLARLVLLNLTVDGGECRAEYRFPFDRVVQKGGISAVVLALEKQLNHEMLAGAREWAYLKTQLPRAGEIVKPEEPGTT